MIYFFITVRLNQRKKNYSKKIKKYSQLYTNIIITNLFEQYLFKHYQFSASFTASKTALLAELRVSS